MNDEEITRALAEKIMGWPVVRTYEDAGRKAGEFQSYIADIPEPGFFGKVHPPQAVHHSGESWAPLERIEHAWEIRAVLLEHGDVSIGSHPERVQFTPSRQAQLAGPWRWAHVAEHDHSSTCRAICLAALRAIGLEPEP